MPPRFRLDDDQIEILQNWSAAGAQRGEPRADNQDPSAAIVSNERTGMRHALTIRVDDPDQDVVGGSLYARINNTDTFVGLLSSGAAQIAWDATGVAAGTYRLSAHLDDGAAEIVVDIGSITVGGP